MSLTYKLPTGSTFPTQTKYSWNQKESGVYYLNYLILGFKIPHYAHFTDKETKVLSKIRDLSRVTQLVNEDKNPYLKRMSGSNNPVLCSPFF